MTETKMIEVGERLPSVAHVEASEGLYSVTITWGEGPRMGRVDLVDLAPMIFTYKVFAPLRENRDLFRSVRVGEWGGSIEWEGNDDLAVAATTLADLAEQTMTNEDFAAFLKRNGLTLDRAAAELGIARRLVAYYAKDRAIPRYISLACAYLDDSLAESRVHNIVSKNFVEGFSSNREKSLQAWFERKSRSRQAHSRTNVQNHPSPDHPHASFQIGATQYGSNYEFRTAFSSGPFKKDIDR
ncbi:hypothetical protein M446_1150 [Methylobacterium sp. 4-46]|uniref:DUF2442 domain-containing protein n=1 Tax=unclassified Methylobacterium TaxID=2615210 RepID=UPI000165C81E|nr:MULTISPECIES: DUF2442 domain-containing protein [Methylobacterium]ACA15676.1 hypothetical protein M446_1150 [Methylobacterium sp. 4-46]WFT81388.1 DUF2442 domain-containing protein [Methylobacterium nodulans]